ncbi:MAG: hypothetical protein JWN90_352 [Parcubacteria group bacterium]|nr:hypothetical protein [Parcubacteria group bacterium]
MLIAVIVIILIGLGFYAFGMSNTGSYTATSTADMQGGTTDTGVYGQPTTVTTVNSTTTTTTASSSANTAKAGEHCGGNMATAKKCIVGYKCAPVASSTLPFGDVGGICVSN